MSYSSLTTQALLSRLALTETAFLERLANGDKTIFKALYDNRYAAICLFADRYLRNQETAEEAADDAFMKARDHDRFETFRHLMNFIYKVTYNDCISRLRANDRRRRAEQDSAYHIDMQTPDPDLEQHLSEQYLHLLTTIRELPADQQQVILASYIHKITNKELAEQQNITPNAISVKKARAIRFIRNRFGGQEPILYLFYMAVTLFS